MSKRRFRTRLLLSSALVGAALLAGTPSGSVRAQVVIDNTEIVRIPEDREDPWIVNDDLIVGRDTSAILLVRQGGTVDVRGNITLGNGAVGGATQVMVSGPGSSLSTIPTGSAFRVGSIGTTFLAIEDGGLVDINGGSFVDATGDGHLAQVLLRGTGSTWRTSHTLVIGRLGTGVVNVLDGGLLVSEFTTRLGVEPDTSGTVTVSGAGSRWENGFSLSVGSSPGGVGTLNILDGGVVTSGSTTLIEAISGLPLDPDGVNAQITVADPGSRLEAGDSLRIGDALATAILTIRNDGFVSANQVQMARLAGGTAIVNIGAEAGQVAVAPGIFETPSIEFGAGAGILNFNHSGTAHEFAPALIGSGSVNHLAGTTVLTGDSSAFTGTSDVSGGELRVKGTLGGTTLVGDRASLSGIGTLTGRVTVADGATVSPGDNGIGTLSVGSLALAAGAHLNFDLGTPGVAGGASNDLINVAGDVTLDGTLNITDAGGFGPGVYRLINYGGSLIDNGLDIGTGPGGVTPANLSVQTSVANQVNLISNQNTELNFWDGADTGRHDNGAG